jgi:diadenosine tetraphosphate (Ap4A) HIT family hydrolase
MKKINFEKGEKNITDFLDKNWICNCVGCGVGDKSITPPGGIIYETETFVIHQDPMIPIEGFLIVAAKNHIHSLVEFTDSQRHELIDIINVGINSLKKSGISNEITVVQEERSSHFHVWLFPWHEWMNNNFEKGVSNLRDINSYAMKNASKEDKDRVIECVRLIRNNIKIK